MKTDIYEMLSPADIGLDNEPMPSVGKDELLSSTDSVRDYQHAKVYQSGKRCGIIFVAKDEMIIDPDSPLTYTRWKSHHSSSESDYSFIVVKGKVSNIYSFPKGRVTDEFESEESCAIRELYEETGISIDSVGNLPRIILGKNVYFIYHTTKDAFTTFTINDTFEVGEVGWKSIRELSRLVCNKDIRAVLRYPQQKRSFHKRIFEVGGAPPNPRDPSLRSDLPCY